MEAVAAAIMALILTLQFFFEKNCDRVFYPILFIVITMMNAAGGDLSCVYPLLLCAIPLFTAMIYNVVRNKKKLRKNSAFISMLCVSVALTLGGAFSISAKEYFAIGNLYYVFFLGFGMVGFCAFFSVLFDGSDNESTRREFIRALCDSGMVLAFVLIVYYLLGLNEVTASLPIGENIDHNPLRNIAVSYFFLAMPFAFYCSKEKPVFLLGGVLIYASCILSGSRMGLLFGTAQFIVCMLFFIATVKKRKWLYAVVFVVLLTVLVFSLGDILDSYVERLTEDFGSGNFINVNESRFELMRRSVKDFLSNPIFGRGLGYTGNEDCYMPAQFEMHWYHNFVCQIIGSLGILGIVAYMYQLYSRVMLIFKRPSSFGWLVGLMYVGALMSGITDTGIFTPFPTVFLLSFAFILVAKETDAQDAAEAEKAVSAE